MFQNDSSRIGDGTCHAFLNVIDCCFDGGDCLKANHWCSSCPNPGSDFNVGNGICDQDLNTGQCCFDGNDCAPTILQNAICPTCNNHMVSLLGNIYLQNGICEVSNLFQL